VAIPAATAIMNLWVAQGKHSRRICIRTVARITAWQLGVSDVA
jgi:hypothetical protein